MYKCGRCIWASYVCFASISCNKGIVVQKMINMRNHVFCFVVINKTVQLNTYRYKAFLTKQFNFLCEIPFK